MAKDTLFERIHKQRALLNRMEALMEQMYVTMGGMEKAGEGFERLLAVPKDESGKVYKSYTEDDARELREIKAELDKRHFGNGKVNANG